MGTLIKCIMINKQQGACGTNLSNLTNDLSASSSTDTEARWSTSTRTNLRARTDAKPRSHLWTAKPGNEREAPLPPCFKQREKRSHAQPRSRS